MYLLQCNVKKQRKQETNLDQTAPPPPCLNSRQLLQCLLCQFLKTCFAVWEFRSSFGMGNSLSIAAAPLVGTFMACIVSSVFVQYGATTFVGSKNCQITTRRRNPRLGRRLNASQDFQVSTFDAGKISLPKSNIVVWRCCVAPRNQISVKCLLLLYKHLFPS